MGGCVDCGEGIGGIEGCCVSALAFAPGVEDGHQPIVTDWCMVVIAKTKIEQRDRAYDGAPRVHSRYAMAVSRKIKARKRDEERKLSANKMSDGPLLRQIM